MADRGQRPCGRSIAGQQQAAGERTATRSRHADFRRAGYLALALVNIICVLLPPRIILGGGVMQQPCLLPLVRGRVRELLHDYLAVTEIQHRIDEYIVPPALGGRAGVLGAIALAQKLVCPAAAGHESDTGEE